MAFQLLTHQQQQYPEYFKKILKGNTQNLPVDDYLITIAAKYQQELENEVFIATNDKELRKKASKRGIRAIYMRQKKYLEVSR